MLFNLIQFRKTKKFKTLIETKETALGVLSLKIRSADFVDFNGHRVNLSAISDLDSLELKLHHDTRNIKIGFKNGTIYSLDQNIDQFSVKKLNILALPISMVAHGLAALLFISFKSPAETAMQRKISVEIAGLSSIIPAIESHNAASQRNVLASKASDWRYSTSTKSLSEWDNFRKEMIEPKTIQIPRNMIEGCLQSTSDSRPILEQNALHVRFSKMKNSVAQVKTSPTWKKFEECLSLEVTQKFSNEMIQGRQTLFLHFETSSTRSSL